MRLGRIHRICITLLFFLALATPGCSTLQSVWFAQGEPEKTADKNKPQASSKEKGASAQQSPSPKPDKPEAKDKAASAQPSPPAKPDKPEAKEADKKGEKPLTESQKEWEEKVTRSPYLVSGEYFRQRDPGGTFNLDFGKLFGRSKEAEQTRKDLEERIAKLEARLAGGAAANADSGSAGAQTRAIVANGRGPMNRVAMVALEAKVPNPQAFGRIPLEIVASALEKEPRLIVVEPPMVDRALQDRGIRPAASNAKEVAKLLERDLGTQLVVLLDEASVSADWDRRGQVHAQVVLKAEVREGVSGQALSLLTAKGMQTGSASQEALAKVEALKQASDQLSTTILKKALEYEWTARVLSVEDGRLRLNVGRRSGLQEGDLLRVFKHDGQEIYHPTTKLFVGIDLGDPKGRARVTDFFGADAAIAKITEGSGFAPNDLIKLEKR